MQQLTAPIHPTLALVGELGLSWGLVINPMGGFLPISAT